MSSSKEQLTQKRLKLLVTYDLYTGKFVWNNSMGNNRIKKGAEAGSLTSYGYIRIKLEGEEYLAHRLAWLYVYGKFPEGFLDHKNQRRTDNWITNLKEATNSTNQKNAKKHKGNKSGHTGVYFNKRAKKYRAYITSEGKNIHLGYFSSKEDALAARKAANSIHFFSPTHGEETCRN